MRKRGELAADLQERRYWTLIDHAIDPVFVHDSSGRIIEVSRLACKSLGYTREELLTMNVVDIETDHDLARAQAAWSLLQPDAAIILLQGHHRRKDGSRFPVEVRYGFLEIDGQRLFVGAARDLTETERASNAARTEASRLRLALDAAQAGTWEWDLRTNRHQWSDEVFRLYGLAVSYTHLTLPTIYSV